MAGGGGLPTGLGGAFGSTMGYGGTAGKAGLNTTSAVTGADGKLTAYDPATMTKQVDMTAPTLNQVGVVGMDSSGLPSYLTNWLQSGGKGDAPMASTGPMTSTSQSAVGALSKPTALPAPKPPTAAKPPVAKPNASAAATPTANTGIKPVNMNWVNNPANLAVADVYNPSQGGSAPGVVQKSGTYNPIQAFIQPNGMMPQFYSDGKGGYYSDAAGKMPLPKNVVDYMKFNGIQ